MKRDTSYWELAIVGKCAKLNSSKIVTRIMCCGYVATICHFGNHMYMVGKNPPPPPKEIEDSIVSFFGGGGC